MASAGRSGRLLSCVGKKSDKKAGRNYYSFEPLYEELNDLRTRKSRYVERKSLVTFKSKTVFKIESIKNKKLAINIQ